MTHKLIIDLLFYVYRHFPTIVNSIPNSYKEDFLQRYWGFIQYKVGKLIQQGLAEEMPKGKIIELLNLEYKVRFEDGTISILKHFQVQQVMAFLNYDSRERVIDELFRWMQKSLN